MNTRFKQEDERREAGEAAREGSRIKVRGYAAVHATGGLVPFEFERAAPGPDEVRIDILYCGVCHSDIHQVKNEWSNTVYPCLPGHEIVGRVAQLGSKVSQHSIGDLVGVGCMVDSCGTCEPCKVGDQNYCESPNGFLATYNGPMVPAAKAPGGANVYGIDNTFGGYSDCIVVDQKFVLRIPPALEPQAAAPILCAGVTTYSPLKHWGVGPGTRVGVVGFGGLGDMAAKLARAMGAEVTLFTRTEAKAEDANRLGVQCVLETDSERLATMAGSFDFILSTVPQKHDVNPYVQLLKRDATLCIVGALEPLQPIHNGQLAFHRRRVAGSLIGNLADTQEVLDFCAEHGVAPDIQMIGIDDVNEAFDLVEKAEVRFRYVIDMASLRTR